MTQQEQIQAEDDEITVIDILLFLKASGGNILKSTCVCLLAGGAYYFSVPKMYEASATIEMAMVAGEVVETPEVLLEKIKLPLFFSSMALHACGSDTDLNSHTKFADKLKPTISKSAPLISLSAQALSTQEARACLNAVISEIQKSQNNLANPVIEQKKQKLAVLSDQLKVAKEMANICTSTMANNNVTDTYFAVLAFVMSACKVNSSEISDLRIKISDLENVMIPPNTQPPALAALMYSTEVSTNKRPLLTLGCSLALGLFLGLLITGWKVVVYEILRQMREAEAKRV